MDGGRRLRLVVLVTVAVATGLGSLALAGTGRGSPQGLMMAEQPVMALVIGWSFAGAGVAASALRPHDGSGFLLYLTGIAWFASALMTTGHPVPFTLGLLTAPWWLGVFLHALHAFPGGGLRTPWSRVLVALLYVDVTLVQGLRLLFTPSDDLPGCTGCPDNVLLVDDRPDVAVTLLVIQQAVIGSVVIGGTLVVFARRWRAATTPQRRQLAPVLASGALCLAVQAVSLATQPASVRQSVGWVGAAAFAAVPAAFLWGLLRRRLDRSVGQLVVDLGTIREGDPLDGLLRTALRDPSLKVAYWREESAGYVDAAGRPFLLPSSEDRAVTGVERDGRRIAALVHDPAVVEDPDLVSGTVAAAGLALENARLHAEVRAQLQELRASRRRLVDAGDEERRRLERNLHDGAQQRLLAVSLLLSRLERSPEVGPASRALATEARAELSQSLEELRELATGLHPAVLTDHGLAVALDGITARTPIPVELVVELPRRPPPHVEVVAYYVISEGLANVVKHACAGRVTVRVCSAGETSGEALRVDVVDDGAGGVDPGRGSGLQGLRDRLAAVDGTLEVISPPGVGTTLRAVIPCG